MTGTGSDHPYDRFLVRALVVAVVVALLAACSGDMSAGSTSLAPTTVASTTAGSSPPTTDPPVECPPAPYQLDSLPFGVGSDTLDPEEIEPDVWTSVGGTSTTFFGRDDGTVAIALIRGTLPAVDWPGEKGEVSIDGTRGVAGPHPDGTWAVGWYEEPGERCNLYSMIFYPPVSPPDVQETIAGMNRVGG